MDGLIRQHVPEADMLPDPSVPSAVGAVEVAVDHPLARDERVLFVIDEIEKRVLPHITQSLGIILTPQLADAGCNVAHGNPFAGFAFVGDAR